MLTNYYGDTTKWFIGVVKDVEDPLNSNRVRVHIRGIHGEPNAQDYIVSDAIPEVTNIGPNPATTPAPQSPVSPVAIDISTVPSHTQLDAKISKYYTLRNLALVGSSSAITNGQSIANGKLTQTIIRNLSSLATNCLDVLNDATPISGFRITSCWRPGAPNHGDGVAVDITYGSDTLNKVNTAKIANLLYGRFSFIFYERDHIHIQAGAGAAVGTIASPMIKYIDAGASRLFRPVG